MPRDRSSARPLRASTPCSPTSAHSTRANTSTSARSAVRRPRARVSTQRTSSRTPTRAWGRRLLPNFYVDEMKRLTEQLIQAKAVPAQGCTSETCKVGSRDRTNDAKVFTCAECGRLWHFACLGYPSNFQGLPSLTCLACHKALHTSPADVPTVLTAGKGLVAAMRRRGISPSR